MDHPPDQPAQTDPPRPAIYRDLVLLQLTALVFLLDQFSKFLVRELLELRESFPEQGFFRFTHTFNTGSAFGLFQDQNFALILASVAGITVLTLIYQSQRRPTNLLRLSLGLQLGGAAGNLLDRLRMGHVTDFVDVGPWPIFNLADSAIVVGLVLLVWLFIAPGQAREQAGSQADAASGDGETPGLAHTSADACGSREESTPASPDSPDPRPQDSSPAPEDRELPRRSDGSQAEE